MKYIRRKPPAGFEPEETAVEEMAVKLTSYFNKTCSEDERMYLDNLISFLAVDDKLQVQHSLHIFGEVNIYFCRHVIIKAIYLDGQKAGQAPCKYERKNSFNPSVEVSSWEPFRTQNKLRPWNPVRPFTESSNLLIAMLVIEKYSIKYISRFTGRDEKDLSAHIKKLVKTNDYLQCLRLCNPISKRRKRGEENGKTETEQK